MKNLMAIGLLTFAVATTGCAMKQKIMDVSLVSMTRYNLPAGGRLKELGDVTGKYCADQWNDKGSIGLFDQAIIAAQKQSGADFISNASFFKEGSCVTVEGMGEKIVASAAAGAAPTAPRAPHK